MSNHTEIQSNLLKRMLVGVDLLKREIFKRLDMDQILFSNERRCQVSEIRCTIRSLPGGLETANSLNTFDSARHVLINSLGAFFGESVISGIHEHRNFTYEDDEQRRLEVIADGTRWAFRAHYPDSIGRFWITEASITQIPTKTRERVYLQASHSAILAQGETGVSAEFPDFIRDLIDSHSLSDGNTSFRMKPSTIATEISGGNRSEATVQSKKVDDLVKFMASSDRHQPIVVFAMPQSVSGQRGTDLERREYAAHVIPVAGSLVQRAKGFAHIVILDMPGALFEPKGLTGLCPGDIRVYPPRGERADRVYTQWSAIQGRPRVISPWRAFENDLLRRLASTTCLHGAGLAKKFSPFLELQAKLISPAVSPKTQAIGAEDVFNSLVVISEKLEAISAQEAGQVDHDPEAIANDLKRYIDDLRKLQAVDPIRDVGLQSIFEETIATGDKLRRGFVAAAYGILTPYQEKYDALNAWVEENYGDQVVLSSAVKSMLKNPKAGKYRDVNLIYAAVETLATNYYKMKVSVGQEAEFYRARFESHLARLHLEDDPSLSPLSFKNRLLRDDYTVKVDGEKHILGRHLKRGGSADPTEIVRVYYAWDEKRKRVVIGGLAGHKPNTLTN